MNLAESTVRIVVVPSSSLNGVHLSEVPSVTSKGIIYKIWKSENIPHKRHNRITKGTSESWTHKRSETRLLFSHWTLTLPYPTLPYPTLPCPTLPYLTLSCATRLSFSWGMTSFFIVWKVLFLRFALLKEFWSQRNKEIKDLGSLSAQSLFAIESQMLNMLK